MLKPTKVFFLSHVILILVDVVTPGILQICPGKVREFSSPERVGTLLQYVECHFVYDGLRYHYSYLQYNIFKIFPFILAGCAFYLPHTLHLGNALAHTKLEGIHYRAFMFANTFNEI